MVLQIEVLDNSLFHIDDRHLPKNDQKYILQKNGSLCKEDIMRLFYDFLVQYNDMVANLFWYLHFYFFLMREEIHIVRMDDHFQHIHSNLFFKYH